MADPALRMVVSSIMLTGAMMATVAPYFSLLAITTFGFSDSGYSLLLALSAGVNVTASFTIGILTDQRARRRGLALVAATAILIGGMLVWARPTPMSFALTHVVIWPIGFTLVSQLFALARLAAPAETAAQRDGVMATIRAFFAVPFVAILPIWALAFAHGVGVMRIYPVITLLGLAAVVVILIAWPRDGQTRWTEKPSGLSFRAALKELAAPRILGRVVLVSMIHGGSTIYMALAGLLFHEAPGRDTADTSLFVGLIAGLEVPVMLAMPWALARLSKPVLIGAASVLYGCFLASFGQFAAAPWVWFLALPAALGAGVILSLPIAYLQDLVADRPGAGGALISMLPVGGSLVSAAVFALGTSLSGYPLSALLGAIVTAAAGLVLILVDRRT